MTTDVRRNCIVLAGLTLAAQSSPDILKAVDASRHPWGSYQVEVLLAFKGQSQRWKVTLAENRDVRVDGLSKKELGRTVLVLGQDMWLLLPNSKRPMRVTPQQRLLGPAAGGDLAHSSFADDFDIVTSEEAKLEGQPCLRLELAAKKVSNSYRTAQLWVSERDHHPLKAEYRLASGKLARTVTFESALGSRGKRVLNRMTIEEPNGSRSDLQFEGWTPTRPDPELFKLPGP
jgi:outer membrane lipoprotein-sorting protein